MADDGLFSGSGNAGAVGDTLSGSYYAGAGKTTNYATTVESNLPGPAGPFAKLIIDGQSAAKSGDGFDIGLVAADAVNFTTSCVTTGLSIAADPLGWLINQGLSFLINVCTPVKQAIDLVSGNPSALKAASTHFANIGTDLEKFSTDLVSEAQSTLKNWDGDAATAAAARIGDYAEGVSGTAGKAGGLAQLLMISSMVCQVAEDFIKGLLSSLVEWLIITWLAALATAPSTFGGSTAAASAVTEVKAAETTAEASEKVSAFTRILNKIKDLLTKLQGFLTKSKAANKFWADTGKGGTAMDRTAGQAFGKAVENGWRSATGLNKTTLQGAGDGGKDLSYVDPAKVGSKVSTYGKGIETTVKDGDIGADQSDDQINNELNI